MAEQLVNEFTVNRPIEEAWPVICDVERIAPCMPGAQLEEIEGDVYRGVVKIKLGAVSTQFKGQAQFVERDDVNHRAKLRAEGRDTGGRGNAAADITADGRGAVADEHQVHRHHRPPHHRQGGAVRPRHHGRRQQEADGAVRRQPEHDARRHRPRQGRVRRAVGARRRGQRRHRRRPPTAARPIPRRRATDRRPRRRRSASSADPATEPIDVAGMAGPALVEAHRSGGARAAHRVPAAAPTPLTPMDDRARVRELLGREPRGDFEVVVRGDDGDPVVLRNAPLLDDGTPMPTRYWLVGPDEVRRVSQLEATGGVRAAEAAIDAALIDDAHRRYAAERDALVPDDHAGPRPSVAGSAAREPASSASTPTTHGTSRAATTRSAAGSAEQLELPAEVRDHARRVGDGDRGDNAKPSPDRPARCGRPNCRGASSTSPRPSSKAPIRHRPPSSPTPSAPSATSSTTSCASHSELIDIAAVTFSGPLATHAGPPRSRHGRRCRTGSSSLATRPRRSSERSPPRPRRDRAYNPGLPLEHVDTVVAACCIVLAVMRRLHLDQVTIA